MKRTILFSLITATMMTLATAAMAQTTSVLLPADLAQCSAKLQACYDDLEACRADLDIYKEYVEAGCPNVDKYDPNNGAAWLKKQKKELCANGKDDDGDGDADCDDPDCAKHKACKPKPPKKKGNGGKKPKPAAKPKQSECYEAPYNGQLGDWGWTVEACGVKAALEGTCLTMTQVYKVMHCLDDKIQNINIQHFEVEPGVSPGELQAVVDELQAQIEELRQDVDALDQKYKAHDKKLDELEDALDALRDKVDELWALVHKCLFPYLFANQFSEVDSETGLPTAEAYREECGILAEIPEVRAQVADHEERISALEKQVKKNTKDIAKNKKDINDLKKVKSTEFLSVNLASYIGGAGTRRDSFLSAGAKASLMIKLDGLDFFEMEGFIGANQQYTARERFGLLGGLGFFIFPAQEVLGLGAGYVIASTGGDELEYPDLETPEGEEQLDPDYKAHMALGKIKVKYEHVFKTKAGYKWKLGFDVVGGIGAAHVHDCDGIGWDFAWMVQAGLTFHFPVPGVSAP